jgi:hypothetical protein
MDRLARALAAALLGLLCAGGVAFALTVVGLNSCAEQPAEDREPAATLAMRFVATERERGSLQCEGDGHDQRCSYTTRLGSEALQRNFRSTCTERYQASPQGAKCSVQGTSLVQATFEPGGGGLTRVTMRATSR